RNWTRFPCEPPVGILVYISFLLQLSAALYYLHNPNKITENGPKFGSIDGGCEHQSVWSRYQQR
ncbi:hypothetical protein, partial [Vibrio parahaemolyticus]|uniref:hypothetical protein n=1 Tax=Vibrio parahaemolyticus TaxID=670 RepID=UPI00211C53FD